MGRNPLAIGGVGLGGERGRRVKIKWSFKDIEDGRGKQRQSQGAETCEAVGAEG